MTQAFANTHIPPVSAKFLVVKNQILADLGMTYAWFLEITFVRMYKTIQRH